MLQLDGQTTKEPAAMMMHLTVSESLVRQHSADLLRGAQDARNTRVALLARSARKTPRPSSVDLVMAALARLVSRPSRTRATRTA